MIPGDCAKAWNESQRYSRMAEACAEEALKLAQHNDIPGATVAATVAGVYAAIARANAVLAVGWSPS